VSRLALALALALGSCRSTIDLGGNPDGSTGTDAGASTSEPHVVCASDADCVAPRVCRSDEDATSVCRQPCTSASDCANGLCVRLHFGITEAFCALTCDPLGVGTANGCPAGEACDLLERRLLGTCSPPSP
jgi:hypothetical protein